MGSIPDFPASTVAKAPAAADPRALADALLAQAQQATDPATVRALLEAARVLLARP